MIPKRSKRPEKGKNFTYLLDVISTVIYHKGSSENRGIVVNHGGNHLGPPWTCPSISRREQGYIMKIKANIFLESVVKMLLIKSRLPCCIKPLAHFLLRLVYIAKFVEWCNVHANLAFNDVNKYSILDHQKRYKLHQFLIETEHLTQEIDYLEFGVYTGESLKYWLTHNKNPLSRFVGFDTFTGLPEDWGGPNKGAFSTGGQVPDIQDSRCSFEVGLFQETLGEFLSTFSFHRRLVIHMDANLYSSTLFVLTRLAPALKKDDIIIFDDFSARHGFTHEFRAFMDFVSAYRVNYKVLGAVNNYWQVAIKLV